MATNSKTYTRKSITSSTPKSTEYGPSVISGSNGRCGEANSKQPPIQFKRGTARAFRRDNPILFAGQPAVEMDTHRLKIGDGFTRWRQLPYVSSGSSAYDIWLAEGNDGSVDDFLTACVGETGASAYQIWLSLGNEGSMSDFIVSLQGDSAYQLWIKEGNKGSIADFLESLNGPSAYEIWASQGNTGTEEDFIESLKGESAYDIWIDEGNEGTVEDFLESLRGEDGDSAYDQYVEGGGTLTETEFIEVLVNPVQWGTF